MSNFVIIRPLGVELFRAEDGHTDGRTDRDNEANRGFSQFLRKLLKWSYYTLEKKNDFHSHVFCI
jgi:hypothetical protein